MVCESVSWVCLLGVSSSINAGMGGAGGVLENLTKMKADKSPIITAADIVIAKNGAFFESSMYRGSLNFVRCG